jgi:hypothetical protein
MLKVRGFVEYTQRRAKKGAARRMNDWSDELDNSRIRTDRTVS